MPGAISLFTHQLGVLWKHFGINQKVSILLALAAAIAAVAAILIWSGRPDFRLLYTGMSLEDAATAQERLQEEKIPVQLRQHGQALYVPSADVYRARLLLAASGLPKDHSAGFELFEQPKFGLTEFAQQVNYQRALQGELERTIAAVDGVQSARVMLVMPRDRLFASERDKTSSASIMLSIGRGARLSPEQVHSIRQLVSTAVPGLSNGHITVSDQQGRLLSDAARDNDHILGSANRQIDMRRVVEEELTRKAQDMLDLALGAEKAIVRVSADIDFRRTEQVRETFDAEARVLVRETISTESSTEPARTGLGTTARVAVGDPASLAMETQTAGGQMKREDVDSEYRVPSAKESIFDQGGRIERLSVSVSIAQGDEPRDAQALLQIERMVRSAVGAVNSPQRTDSVEVVEMPFYPSTIMQPATEMMWWHKIPFSLPGAMRILGGLALLLVMVIISRRTLVQLSVERENTGTPISMLTQANAPSLLGATQDDVEREETELTTVERLAEQNPASVATWIDHTVRAKS